jgi:hypothetical protein
MSVEPEYLTTEEAAKLLGMSKRTLANMRRYRQYQNDPNFTPPPFYRFGRGDAIIRYNRAELLLWAKAKEDCE